MAAYRFFRKHPIVPTDYQTNYPWAIEVGSWCSTVSVFLSQVILNGNQVGWVSHRSHCGLVGLEGTRPCITLGACDWFNCFDR